MEAVDTAVVAVDMEADTEVAEVEVNFLRTKFFTVEYVINTLWKTQFHPSLQMI